MRKLSIVILIMITRLQCPLAESGAGGRAAGRRLLCCTISCFVARDEQAMVFSGKDYHWRELPQVSFLSRQTRVSRVTTRLVATTVCFCRDKIMFVATKYFCRDKSFVTTNICRDKHNFVSTSILLSRQTRICRDKHVFVATKMILVTAPASDKRAFVFLNPVIRLGVSIRLGPMPPFWGLDSE